MSRSFDGLTESPASVDQIHAAFSREDYWLARIAVGAATASTTLDSLTVDDDGTVRVRVVQHLGPQLLPGLVAKVVPGELKLVHSEMWRPDGEGRVSGEINVSTSPGLGSGRAETRLTPTGDGSQLHFAVNVKVKIPLVGGKIEKNIGSNLVESIPAVLEFTTTWIAENA
jgi:uncharacterized protein DUF2505